MNISGGFWKKPTLIFQKDKKRSPCAVLQGCAGIQLQRFVGNQLAHRDALLIEAIGSPVPSFGIADNQNVDRLQVGREVKFLPQNIGIEVAYPHRSKTQLRGLEHHVVGQDRGVNVAGLLLVKRPHPCLIVVGAEIMARALRRCWPLCRSSQDLPRSEQQSGEPAGGWQRWGLHEQPPESSPASQLHLRFLIIAYRHTLLCNRNKIHSTRSFLYFYYEPIKSTIDLIVAPENKTARMHFFGRYFPKR